MVDRTLGFLESTTLDEKPTCGLSETDELHPLAKESLKFTERPLMKKRNNS
jgi:hypothetical protein